MTRAGKTRTVALIAALVSTSVAKGQTLSRERGVLEPSVILRNERDYQHGVERLERAAARGCRHVNLVITINCEVTPDEQQATVLRYGLGTRSGRRWQFTPLSDDVLNKIVGYYRPVIRKAVENEMAIAVLCHLDVGAQKYIWRNWFRFDPLVKLEGYSYQSCLIEPLLRVLSEDTPAGHRIDFSIAGEMGTSVFAHPRSWYEILNRVRRELADRQLAVGVSFNHDGVAGKHAPSAESAARLTQLLEECDFVGFSNYGTIGVPPQPGDFAANVTRFAADFERLGVPLPDETVIHFSEIGLGGYGPQGLTTDPDVAVKSLWEGTKNRHRSPWENTRMHAFRVAYFRALLEFLKSQPAQWPVDVAFLWSEGSWDPQGIADPHFVDEAICQMIADHNAAIRSRGE